MSGTIKSFFSDSLKKFVRKKINGTQICKMHYSQCGEVITAATMILRFFKINHCLFFDVGSLHQHSSSYTLLHNMGWQGINIDPRSESMQFFDYAPQILFNSESCRFFNEYANQTVEKKVIIQSVSNITYLISRFISVDNSIED